MGVGFVYVGCVCVLFEQFAFRAKEQSHGVFVYFEVVLGCIVMRR